MKKNQMMCWRFLNKVNTILLGFENENRKAQSNLEVRHLFIRQVQIIRKTYAFRGDEHYDFRMQE